MAAGYRSRIFWWFTGYNAGETAPPAPELWTRPGTVTSPTLKMERLVMHGRNLKQ